MSSSFTTNLHFELPSFNTNTWHDAVNGNFEIIDQLFGLLGVSFTGIWSNSVAYVIGDVIIDPNTFGIYRCNVDHTSSSSGNFAADRVLHPSYWTIVVSDLPTTLVASNYVRVNSSGTAYELRTPAQSLSDFTAETDITLTNAAAGSTRNLVWKVNSLLRWAFGKTALAESGSNVGSNLIIQAYNDAGTLIGSVLSFLRSDLSTTFGGKAYLQASTTAGASGNAAHGTAPASPANGDFWTTTAGWFVRISGATYGLWNDGYIHGSLGKTTPTGADEIIILDSAASFVAKVLTWANLLAGVLASFNGSNKALPVDADRIWVGDSTASNTPVYTTLTQFKAYLKTYLDTLYSAIGHVHTFASLTSKPTTLAGYGITDGGGSTDAYLTYQQSSGVSGGSSAGANGSWLKYPYNTKIRDTSSLISLVSNEFIPASNGWVEWSIACYGIELSSRLWDVTNGALVTMGIKGDASTAPNTGAVSTGGGPTAAGVTYRIEVQTTHTNTDGLGLAANLGIEVYGRLHYRRD